MAESKVDNDIRVNKSLVMKSDNISVMSSQQGIFFATKPFKTAK